MISIFSFPNASRSLFISTWLLSGFKKAFSLKIFFYKTLPLRLQFFFRMHRMVRFYLDSYRGLSTPVWMLAMVILINRTGAMVLPFLGIYMTTSLGFSLKEAGYVLGCFGIGAVLGSVGGGWLTDKFGSFKVQTSSLFLSVPVFILLPFLKSFETLAAGIFILSYITETFRPANSVSISHYAHPKNITRAFSLNRMALNLGFSIGPALGGFLAAISYHLLFYGNAFSTTVAGIVFYFYFHQKEKQLASTRKLKERKGNEKLGVSPWKDTPFLLFSILCCLFSLCFFQFLSTLPLYYKEVYLLDNFHIGLLLGFNGLVVFSLEMILVSTSEKILSPMQLVILGVLLCGFSFLILIAYQSISIIYLSMFLLSVSEILVMPFMSTIAINRAAKGREGTYMGLNSLSFSAAHIFSPVIGTAIAAHYDFNTLWVCTAALAAFASLGLWYIKKRF